MKLLIALCLVLVLSGCVLCPERVVVQEVKVLVPTPCVKQLPEKPVYPLKNAKLNDDIFDKTKMALAEIELRDGYETKLEAVLEGCKE